MKSTCNTGVACRCLLIILLLLLYQGLQAQQNPQPFFRNYGTEQGLPSPEVYFAFEDSRGYMWFGTDNGASRFDGYTFRNYGVADGLTSNVVFNILEDTMGRIWFGTMTGEAFILEGDTVVPYPYNHLVLQFKDHYQGASLVHLWPDGTTCFELNDFMPLKISPKGQIKLIEPHKPYCIMALQEDGFDETSVLWCRDKSRRDYKDFYYEWNRMKKTFLEIAHPDGQRFSFEVFRDDLLLHPEIQILSDDSYLAFLWGDIYCLKENDILWSVPHHASVIEIIPEQNGTIWFCQNSEGGLRRYRDIEAVKSGQYDLYFDGLSVSNLYKDKNGGYWVTTIQKGVFYVPYFQMLNYNKATGLPTDYVTSVASKNEKELFVGLHNDEIYLLNDKDYELKKVASSINKASHIPDLFYDARRDVIWTGPNHFQQGKRMQSLGRSNPEHRLAPYSTHNYDNIQVNSKRQLAANYGSSGFIIVDMDQDTIHFFTAFNSKLFDRYYSLLYDQDDQLWLSNDEGLYQFKDSTLVRPDTSITHPAFFNRIESLKQFPDGSLVLGTRGYGVLVWKEDAIREVTIKEGLASNMIEDLHIDENGVLWAGTFNGLSKITFNEKGEATVRTFSMANGLPSNEIYQINSYNNQVWLCTAGGLVKFHESEEDTFSIQPILEFIEVNDRRLDEDRQDNDFVANKKRSRGVSFKHDNNNFTFQYLAINYRQNGKIPYRYRIRSTDNWQLTENRVANYPSLTPGQYTFEVQAQNQDGYWSESTTYAFEIAQPWWSTAWFRGIVAALLALGAYGLFKYRTNQLAKENRIQREITSLERSALQAQMNPHFIFNCLNSIQNYILKNDQKKAVEFLSRFARLVRLNLNASVNGEIALEDEISLLENYLVLEQERFGHAFNFEISVAEELRAHFVEIPPMLIQPFVENAVIHGLASKEGLGKISIDFASEENGIVITITDNGVGYREGTEEKKDDRHKSVGMSVTRKRLELLGVNTENSLKIHTLKDGDNNVLGTEVRIVIRMMNS